MLFEIGNDIFESEKERNLYYKFFAGYFLNDLIPGYEDRVQKFCNLLNTKAWRACESDIRPVVLSPESTHLSFDNHAYLIKGWEADRGEFADVFLHDRDSNFALAIEVKSQTDWNFEKDISSNARRLNFIAERLGSASICQCLLLSKAKWAACKSQINKKTSHFKRLCGSTFQIRVILWEDLIPLCDNSVVAKFIENHIKPQYGYEIQGGKFQIKIN